MTTSTGTAGVRVRGAGRAFGDRYVLSGLDLDIAPGEFVALIGKSGSGKSTLLRAIGGLDAQATGDFEVPARHAIVFQEHRLLPWSRVWRNVTLGLTGGGLRAKAIRALDEVGLADRADAWPVTLSGGESQRVALARALVRTKELDGKVIATRTGSYIHRYLLGALQDLNVTPKQIVHVYSTDTEAALEKKSVDAAAVPANYALTFQAKGYPLLELASNGSHRERGRRPDRVVRRVESSTGSPDRGSRAAGLA
jgi:ABC-type antimicrobial peptide transport system ATPase subunit